MGRMGAGKSTLMKIIQGEVEPDNGRVVINGKIVIEALEQNPKFEMGQSVKEAIENELTELKKAKRRFDEISELLATNYDDKELLVEHAKLSNYLDHHNAWNLDDKIERVLQEFKLKEFEN